METLSYFLWNMFIGVSNSALILFGEGRERGRAGGGREGGQAEGEREGRQRERGRAGRGREGGRAEGEREGGEGGMELLSSTPPDSGLGLLHRETGQCHSEDHHHSGSHAGGEPLCLVK